MIRKAIAFAPATVANVAVGFDLLGFSLSGVGETALVERIDEGVQILPVQGFPGISLDPGKNTATAGLLELIKDKKLNFGFRVQLQKEIPVGSGLGGSSTSAVAAVFAANHLLKKKLTTRELIHYALIGEEVASGSRHADNVAPCLLGGLVYVRTSPELMFERIKIPKNLTAVVVLPNLTVNTKDARKMLSDNVKLKTVLTQTANLAGFILGCERNNFELIRQSLADVMIEPQRAALIPAFYECQRAALRAGALGCSISGSGPAIFALAQNLASAKRIQKSLLSEADVHGLQLHGSWVSSLSPKGASIVRGQRA